jgi:benzylsuccinate CoA-transferase BbsF subunit
MAERVPLPFAGVRVLDFGTLAAGPLVTKLLADYGAEDILVESTSAIASSGSSRQAGPQGVSPINSSYFHNKYNSNKLSLTVDLASPQGREIIRRLIRISDVFLANRLPQMLDKFGLSYDAVRRERPDIIYVVMPAVGSDGPRSFYIGQSWGTQAMAGVNAISGYADTAPASPSPWSHPDVSCNPLHTAVALLAALRHRRRTGRGQMIELSQYESTVAWTGPAILHYSANGTVLERSANQHEEAAPHDVYRCQGEDAWCAISVFTDDQWAALCQMIGRPECASDPRYATAAARREHEPELRGLIEPWTSERTDEEVMHALQHAGVPCAALHNFDGLLHRDPQLRARGLWKEIEHPELGTTLYEGWAFHLQAAQPRTNRAPLLGEHNDYVLQEILGISEDEVNQYIVAGVVQ